MLQGNAFSTIYFERKVTLLGGGKKAVTETVTGALRYDPDEWREGQAASPLHCDTASSVFSPCLSPEHHSRFKTPMPRSKRKRQRRRNS